MAVFSHMDKLEVAKPSLFKVRRNQEVYSQDVSNISSSRSLRSRLDIDIGAALVVNTTS